MIWIIGNKGMLGTDLEKLCAQEAIPFCATDKEIDITNIEAVKEYLRTRKSNHMNWIVNCAAYTAVDKAEDERDKAFAINEKGPENLADISNEINAVLINISTDYVFPGDADKPLFEDDVPSPINIYGESKLMGEKAIEERCRNYYIIRTAWLYGKHNKNFVYSMLDLFSSRDTVRIVSDQWGSPTYTKDLARAIISIIKFESSKSSNRSYGIYHFTNEGKTNWYCFAEEIYNIACELGLIKRKVTIEPISSHEYPTKAKRPKYSYLSKDKIKQTFVPHIRSWEEALRDFLTEIKDEYAK
jgi:dTDP-4-dehydrorhamnose reductase